jgi:5-methylthioadenosine/S-adenosylhomocysteine deaminase
MAERMLIRGVTAITLDPALGDLDVADLLIEDGRIAAIAPRLEIEDAELIDGSSKIAIPGFVDSHRHTWQTQLRSIAADWSLTQYFTGVLGSLAPAYRPEDVYAGNLLGVLEALDAGITTVLDWSHIMNTPEHGDAGYEALVAGGGRAIFGYGSPNALWGEGPDASADWSDLERLRDAHFASDESLVTMAAALRGPDFSSIDATAKDWAAVRALGLPITVHIGIGGFGERSIAALHERGLMGADTTYIHCSRLDSDEYAMIADTGGSVSIAAEVEMHMGHGFPPTGAMLDAGVRPSLSVDVCTGIGGDMFGQMRIALATQRAFENDAALKAGHSPDSLRVHARDALEFATIEGARACGLADRIGTLTPGKDADIVLLDTDRLNMHPLNNPVAAVALAASAINVDTVLVRGEVVKRDGELVRGDLDRVRQLATESRDHLLSQVGAQTGGEWMPEAYVPPGA